MTEHQVQLSPEEAATLRAFLRSPNGSFAAGRLRVESVEGGGLLIRTRPHRPDGIVEVGRGSRMHEMAREMLRAEGERGITMALLSARLELLSMRPSRETLERWMRLDEADGLVEKVSNGTWKATAALGPAMQAPPDRLR